MKNCDGIECARIFKRESIKKDTKKREAILMCRDAGLTSYTQSERASEQKKLPVSQECETIKCDWREFEHSLKWLRQTEQKNFLTIKTEANLTYQQIITNESGKKIYRFPL